MPKGDEELLGRHAILIVGSETDSDQNEWLIFRNSWGERWGVEGYGFLPPEYLLAYNCEAYEIDAI